MAERFGPKARKPGPLHSREEDEGPVHGLFFNGNPLLGTSDDDFVLALNASSIHAP